MTTYRNLRFLFGGAVVASTLPSIWACQVQTSAEVGTTASAFTGASDDIAVTNDPVTQQARDAVVYWSLLTTAGPRACSGTLISPTLVLTASHCLYGNTSTPWSPVPGSFNVATGTSTNALGTPHTVDTWTTILGGPGPQNVSKASRDLAVLHLQDSELAGAWAFRPTLESPTPTAPQNCFSDPDCYAGGGQFVGLTFGVSGWAPGTVNRTTRQYRDLFDLFIERKQYRTAGKQYPYWAQAGGDWSPEPGDSGGPLYILRNASQSSFGNGQRYRDVVGVESRESGSTGDGFWADVTRDENRSWLLAQVQQGTSALATPRSPKWNTQHNKTPASWLGEVDYIGLCDRQGTQAQCIEGNGAAGWDCDCDHWYDHGPQGRNTDDCPNVYNPEQADGLDNGRGDACRTCLYGDTDGDGVCDPCASYDATCNKDFLAKPWTVDNCVAVPNGDQTNGNELAERANHPDMIWGDACDPVPHAKPEAQTREANTNCVTVVDPPIPPSLVPPGTTHQECTGSIQQDEIVGQTVAPHRAGGTTDVGFPVQIAESRERYCQQLLPTFKCDATNVVNDAQVDLWANADAERGNDPGRPWHRVTTRPPLAPAFLAQRDRLLANWTYGITQSRVRWEFTTDFPFWTADPNNPKIPLALFCSTIDCLNGAYWFRTVSRIGDKDPNVGNTIVGLHGDNLANAYGPIRPEAFGVRYCPALPHGLENVQGSSIPLQAPSSPGKLPIIVWPPSTDGVAFANGIHRDADVLVPTGTGVVGVLRSNGTALVAGSVPNCGPAIASDGLSQLAFDASLSWTNALEPVAVGAGPDSVAVAGDGTSLRATATLGTDALTSTLVDCATTGTCGSTGSTPAARSGFSAAYSRALGGVLIAGGTSSAGDQRDVWFLSVGGTPVDVTPTLLGATACASCGDVQPIGRIRAVTYSYPDQKLWLVDEVTQGKLTFQRISRAPLHGSLEVLAVVPKLGIFDRTYLSLDRDGLVLATLARTGLPGFVTARLEVTSSGLRVTGVTRIPGAELLAPPVTSPRSYAFVVRQGKTISVERRNNLLTLPPCSFHEGI